MTAFFELLTRFSDVCCRLEQTAGLSTVRTMELSAPVEMTVLFLHSLCPGSQEFFAVMIC